MAQKQGQNQGDVIRSFTLGNKELEGKTVEFQYDRGQYSITDVVGEERSIVYKSRNAQEAYTRWNVYIGRKKERPERPERQERNGEERSAEDKQGRARDNARDEKRVRITAVSATTADRSARTTAASATPAVRREEVTAASVTIIVDAAAPITGTMSRAQSGMRIVAQTAQRATVDTIRDLLRHPQRAVQARSATADHAAAEMTTENRRAKLWAKRLVLSVAAIWAVQCSQES